MSFLAQISNHNFTDHTPISSHSRKAGLFIPRQNKSYLDY